MKASTQGHQPINIIVILDTSDRISQNGQVESDIEIVKEIVAQFDDLVKKHLQQIDVSNESIGYAHRLAFVVPDQPRTPAIPPNLIRALEIRDPGEGNGYPEFENHRQSLLAQEKDTKTVLYAFPMVILSLITISKKNVPKGPVCIFGKGK